MKKEPQAAVKKESCNCGEYEILRKNFRELQESRSQLSQILKLREQELDILKKNHIVTIE